MTPPRTVLPDAEEARAAWAVMPRSVRGQVRYYAASGHPFPEPNISLLAVAWARACRTNGRWAAKYAIAGGLLTVSTAVWIFLTVTGDPPGPWSLILVGTFAVAVIGATASWWDQQGPVEAANLRAALAAGLLTPDPAGPLTPTGTGPIAHTRQSRLVVLGPIFFLSLYLLYATGTDWYRATRVPAILTGIFVLLYLARMPAESRRVDLTDDGISIPHRKLNLAWRDIAWVDVYLVPAKRQSVAAIRWQPRDGEPVNVPFHWLDVPPEDVIFASRRHLAANDPGGEGRERGYEPVAGGRN